MLYLEYRFLGPGSGKLWKNVALTVLKMCFGGIIFNIPERILRVTLGQSFF